MPTPTPTPNPNHAARTIHTSASFLLPHLSPSFHLLDIGCGPGSITRGFGLLLPTGQITGIDASQDAISAAEAALFSHPELTNTTFQVGSVFALPFADNSLDVVYSSQMFPHLSDPVGAFREIHRVLRPGGILATRDADAYAWYPDLPGLRAYDAALASRLRADGATWPGGREMGRWAREGGFDRAKMRLGVGGTVYTSRTEREWWSGILGEGLEEGGEHRAKLVGSGTSEAEVGELVRDLKVWTESEDGWYGEYDCENIYRK
jgi:ubiquinone/menaquinone biosynthesis C-methylase UbiE